MKNKIELEIVVDDKGTVKVKEFARKTEQSFRRVERSTATFTRSIRNLSIAFGSAFAAYKLMQIGRSLVQVADSYQLLASRLRLVTSSTKEFQEVEERLFQIAQQTGTSLDATVTMYFRMANATRQLGVNSQDLLQVIQVLNQAVVVSGASTQEAQAALLQLSQAMASGRLQGDELRSVLEQMPIVAQMVADYLGVSFGQIRDLASEGKITTQILIDALLQGGSQIKDQFSRIPITVQRAFQTLENSWQRLIGQSGELSEGMDAIKAAFLALSKTIDQMRVGVLAEDFKQLGTISAEVFKILVRGAEYTTKAFLGLKLLWEGLKIAFAGLTEMILTGLQKILATWRNVLVAIENMPVVERLVSDADIALLDRSLASMKAWQNTLKSWREEAKADINTTVKQIEAVGNISEQVLNNFQKQLKNLSKQRKKAASSSAQALPSPGAASLLPSVSSADVERIKNLYGELQLSLKTGLDRQLFQVDQKFQRLLARAQELAEKAPEAFKQTFGSMEEFQKLWSEAWLAEHNRVIEEWKKQNDEMAQFWEHTLERMQDTASDIFFDAMRGEIRSLGDLWNRMLMWMQRSVADYLGQLFTQKVTAPALSSLGSWFGSLFSSGSTGPSLGLDVNSASLLSDMNLVNGASYLPMAEGGIVTRPTLALVGESGPEAVIPLKYMPPQREERIVVNHFVINAADAKSFEDLVRRNPGVILSLVAEDAERNGPTIQAIRRSV